MSNRVPDCESEGREFESLRAVPAFFPYFQAFFCFCLLTYNPVVSAILNTIWQIFVT